MEYSETEVLVQHQADAFQKIRVIIKQNNLSWKVEKMSDSKTLVHYQSCLCSSVSGKSC
jgi:hypothetical protein